jgi:hypothetical protein
MDQSSYRLQGHEVNACPHCQQRHRYALQIGVREGTLVFAGTRAVTVELICPRTREPFPAEIIIGTNEEFIRIADPFASKAAPPVDPVSHPEPVAATVHPSSPAPVDPEFAEWARASRQTAVEYCRGMLTAASAAIPVYFAVLQYLGVEHASRPLVRLAVLPAVLFLLSATVFAVGHRPRLVTVPTDDFDQVRTRTLRRLNRLITIGSALFLAATAGALAVFADLL